MKTIGVLGGMGPRSTTPFLELILDECKEQYGAKYDIDFPHIIIYSLPTPFYIDRPIDENNLKETVIEGLKRLESFGVSFIAMPCNTVHKYYDELMRNINIPLLNIIDETVKCIPQYYSYALKELSYQDLEFLVNKPAQESITLEGLDILCVHGSPRDVMEKMGKEVEQTKLIEMIEGVKEKIVLCGHSHLPSMVEVNEEV